MKQAVLLLAHGAPERIEDLGAYLDLVRGGRPAPAELRAELRRRYEAIGGASPLTARTREQAEALERKLRQCGMPVRVYFAMRNWRPFIREVMAQIGADGIERVVAICLAPQYSRASIGLYYDRVQQARMELGMKAEIVWTRSFHDHPLLIEAYAEKLAPLLAEDRRVLFTAHSLPVRILEEGDPYDREARATAGAVARRLGLSQWDFAYQSQGATEEPWLGPTVESLLDQYAAEGAREVVIAPIGFVADHLEILYDVDVHFAGYARERGLSLQRTESLNASPTFIAALAAIARAGLEAA
ncbi:MAG: ferrochelatase [Bryobacterales bacterium]|nr:ferrochelatase [Bryobacteraceae bacterium]MDW8129922.1 ferrochelatase [Bryobacterales bacterium]